MAGIKIEIFQTTGGKVPFSIWLAKQSPALREKVAAYLGRLMKEGHCLPPNIGKPLRGKILELRIHFTSRRAYRIFYFFHGRKLVVLSHAMLKKDLKTQNKEIDRAIEYRKIFEADPEKHTWKAQ